MTNRWPQAIIRIHDENNRALREERLAPALFRLLELARGAGELYLFEIFQNALDAGATRIDVSGDAKSLVIAHDNTRRDTCGLSENELVSICGVCVSSKGLFV
jgi:hypothetical protein